MIGTQNVAAEFWWEDARSTAWRINPDGEQKKRNDRASEDGGYSPSGCTTEVVFLRYSRVGRAGMLGGDENRELRPEEVEGVVE